MTELNQMINVETTPASVSVNFAEVRDALSEHLATYDTVVTADGLKEAKATATEINKLKHSIASKRKAVVSELSEPIKTLESRLKELENLCETSRQGILEQARQFDEQTKNKVRNLLDGRRTELQNSLDVKAEFCNADYDDLVIISNLTAKGNLTKKADDAIVERVNADKAAQERREKRLLELENASYKAGLQTPLEYRHVAGIVDDPDDEAYQQALQMMLSDEIERQRQVEQTAADKARRDERRKEQSEPQEVPVDPTPEPVNGKQRWKVVATFYPEVSPQISAHALETELRRIMGDAGVHTLADIQLTRC